MTKSTEPTTTAPKTDAVVRRAAANVERREQLRDAAKRDRERALLHGTALEKANTRDALDTAELHLEAARAKLATVSDPAAVAERAPKYRRLAELRPIAGAEGFRPAAAASLERIRECFAEGFRLAAQLEPVLEAANVAAREAQRLAAELGEPTVEPASAEHELHAQVAELAGRGFDDADAAEGIVVRLGYWVTNAAARPAARARAAEMAAVDAEIERRITQPGVRKPHKWETPELFRWGMRHRTLERMLNDTSTVINGKRLDQQDNLLVRLQERLEREKHSREGLEYEYARAGQRYSETRGAFTVSGGVE